jgi:hypothetical protein
MQRLHLRTVTKKWPRGFIYPLGPEDGFNVFLSARILLKPNPAFQWAPIDIRGLRAAVARWRRVSAK